MIEVWRSTSTLLRAAEETTDSHPVQTLYFLNLTYLNIQIIACIKAHHNPGIVICRQRKPQWAAVEYLEEPTSTLSLLCIAKTDPSEAK